MARASKPITSPEDTRMQRDRMTAEQESAQKARQGELSMVNAVVSANDLEGVWDGQSGELIHPGMSPAEQSVISERFAGEMAEGDEVISKEDAQRPPLGEHQVRTDGPAVGPLGVPITEPGPETSDEVIRMAAPLPDSATVGIGESPAREVKRLNRKDETRIVRINADIDPTIGQGPDAQWHFVKGRRYELPLTVCLHLQEKGFVSSWG